MNQPLDIQAMIEQAIAKQLQPILQAKQAEPEVDMELDDPQVKIYVDKKLDKMVKQLQDEYNAKLKDMQAPMTKLMPALVPGLSAVTPEFDARPLMEGVSVTWGDARKAAEKSGDIEAIKKYVASFDAFQSQSAAPAEPTSSPSRSTAQPTTQAPAPSNRDADLAAFMTGRMDKKDYQAKYGVH